MFENIGNLFLIHFIIDHHNQCVESPDRKKNKSPEKKDFKVSFGHDAEKF